MKSFRQVCVLGAETAPEPMPAREGKEALGAKAAPESLPPRGSGGQTNK
jgi:hypothetical protein